MKKKQSVVWKTKIGVCPESDDQKVIVIKDCGDMNGYG
jgi:hypothetical protein